METMNLENHCDEDKEHIRPQPQFPLGSDSNDEQPISAINPYSSKPLFGLTTFYYQHITLKLVHIENLLFPVILLPRAESSWPNQSTNVALNIYLLIVENLLTPRNRLQPLLGENRIALRYHFNFQAKGPENYLPISFNRLIRKVKTTIKPPEDDRENIVFQLIQNNPNLLVLDLKDDIIVVHPNSVENTGNGLFGPNHHWLPIDQLHNGNNEESQQAIVGNQDGDLEPLEDRNIHNRDQCWFCSMRRELRRMVTAANLFFMEMRVLDLLIVIAVLGVW